FKGAVDGVKDELKDVEDSIESEESPDENSPS
ncbi:uncharacterized protein METZ01_LOCUS286196, partial [marine metagenome]